MVDPTTQNPDFASVSNIIQALEKEVEVAKKQIDSIWPGMPLDEQYDGISKKWAEVDTEEKWNKKTENERLELIKNAKDLIKDVRTFNINAVQEVKPVANKAMVGMIVALLLLFSIAALWYYIEHSMESRNSLSDIQALNADTSHNIKPDSLNKPGIVKIITHKPDTLALIADTSHSKKSDSVNKSGIVKVIPQKIAINFSKKRKETIDQVKDRNKFFRLLGAANSSLSGQKPNFLSAETALDSISFYLSDPLVREYCGKIAYLGGLCTSQRCKTIQDTLKPKQPDSPSVDLVLAIQIKTDLTEIYKEAILVERDDRYFWAVGSKRWKEIYFWALFGIFAGILRWISASKEAGAYSMGRLNREWPWYITEIIIGPFVVISVFFIAGKATASLIEGITESEIKTSIYLTMGLAFVLGFYIRRTIELLLTFANYLKFKSPSSSSSGK